MSTQWIKDLDSKWVIPIDKYQIGMFAADVVDTKDKYIILRENMPINKGTYDQCGYAVLDIEFVSKHYNFFTEEYWEGQKAHLNYALDNEIDVHHVEYHQKNRQYGIDNNILNTVKNLGGYKLNRGKCMDDAEWKRIYEWWPLSKVVSDKIAHQVYLGEYRLGVFTS